MKRLWALGLVVMFGWAGRATAQVPSNDESAPLVLVRIIPMPDVQGRFDHMGVDNKSHRVFAAVYGNDSVEVLDVARVRRVHSMQAEFVKPQMALYLPDLNRIVVSKEDDGACKIHGMISFCEPLSASHSSVLIPLPSVRRGGKPGVDMKRILTTHGAKLLIAALLDEVFKRLASGINAYP